MKKKVEKKAEEYQEIAREIKKLEAKLKPVKVELIEYAESHKAEFDEAYQIKFPNGLYISHRVKDAVLGSSKSKQEFLQKTLDQYADVKLNEKAVIEDAPKNRAVRKLLTKLGLSVGQKESFAVYAG